MPKQHLLSQIIFLSLFLRVCVDRKEFGSITLTHICMCNGVHVS